MYNSAMEQVLAAKTRAEVSVVKLGTVTSITGGRARVQHYGEGTPSGKDYTYIDGYFPEVGDKVAMLPQANTYIIIGKICDSQVEQKWAFKDHNHDGAYVPIADADKLKAGQSGGTTVTLSTSSLSPNSNGAISLGGSDHKYNNVYAKVYYEEDTQLSAGALRLKVGNNTYELLLTYSGSGSIPALEPKSNDAYGLGRRTIQFKELYVKAWKSGASSNERSIGWDTSNNLIPDSTGVVGLGTANNKFGNAFITKLILGAWVAGTSLTAHYIAWDNANGIVPDATEVINIGSSSQKIKEIYVKKLIGALAQSNSSGYIEWSTATAFTPSADNSIDLGSTSRKFKGIYTQKLYLNGTEFNPTGMTVSKMHVVYNTANYDIELTANANGMHLIPNRNNSLNIGSASYKLATLYFGSWHNGTRYVTFDSSHNILPDTTNAVSLGTSSKQYKNIYGQNIYVNGTAVSSDARLKEDIKALEEKHIAFLKALRPVQYKFKDGSSGRTHTGFIAQEVEEAVKESGMTDKDMAAVVKDSEGKYYLRYEEIIAIQTKAIQDLMEEVKSLQTRVAKLESCLAAERN